MLVQGQIGRIVIAFLCSLFLGEKILAAAPHEHSRHHDCAICSSSPTERRKLTAGKIDRHQIGSNPPKPPHQAEYWAFVADVKNHSAFIPIIPLRLSSAFFPPASSVLAGKAVDLPPARAPPVLSSLI